MARGDDQTNQISRADLLRRQVDLEATEEPSFMKDSEKAREAASDQETLASLFADEKHFLGANPQERMLLEDAATLRSSLAFIGDARRRKDLLEKLNYLTFFILKQWEARGEGGVIQGKLPKITLDLKLADEAYNEILSDLVLQSLTFPEENEDYDLVRSNIPEALADLGRELEAFLMHK